MAIARLAAISILLLAFARSAPAQLAATVTDIGPNTSSLDNSNPNGASGGRVNGLAVDPTNNTTFYAASEWGGLFRTADGGNTWVHLDDHVPHTTWDVEVDPSNANRVIATSFYDGRVASQAGIQISLDGGTTWNRANATPPAGSCLNAARRTEPSAFGISFDPDNPGRVYVGTNCGLARSLDSGVTWDFLDPTPGNADDVWDVVVHDGGIIDLCGDDGHRRSTDGGATWSPAPAGVSPPGGQCSIAVSPDEPYVLFVLVGATVWESDDGGATWPTQFAVPGAQGRIPFVVTNDRTGTAFDLWVADTQLFRAGCTTPNPAVPGGGARCPAPPWNNSQNGAHWDAGDLVFNSQAANNACPELYSNDGGVYFNLRNASPLCHDPRWQQPQTQTPHALWLWALSGAQQGGAGAEDLYFVNQDTGTFGAQDAPAAPPTWNNRDCCDGFDTASDPNRVVHSVCCFNMGRFNRLVIRNPGMTGGGQINTYPAGTVPAFRMLSSLANFGPDDYVISMSGNVFLTQDITVNPINWTPLGNAPAQACGLQAATAGGTTSFFVKSGGCNGNRAGGMFRYTGTAPGGNWQQIFRNGRSQFGVFAVDPNNPNRILASDLNNVTGPEMVLTVDGGATWQGLPELDTLMQGNGVFRYQNQRGPVVTGPNTAGMFFGGYAQPTMVAIDGEDGNILVAGAADAGLFVSADGGEDWHLVTDPIDPAGSGTPHIPRPAHAYFDHEPANRVNIYIGTQGRGAWRVSFFRPPVADAGGPYVTDEGTPAVLAGSGSDLDPGPLTLEWDFDADGVFNDAVGANPNFPAPQNGVFPVALRVTDGDGAFDVDTAVVTVNNVPPTVNAGPDVVVFEDEATTYSASFTDPGVLDTHTATVDWGDGSPVEVAAVVQGAGFGTASADHVYPDPGNYTVTFTVTDSDGGVGSDTRTVTVVHAFLQYCFFGLGDRPRADRVDLRKAAFGDCRVGANARVRFKRRVELDGGTRSYEQKVRVGKDNRLTGEVRAGANGKVKRRSTVTGDFTAATDLVLRRRVTLDGNATAGGAVDTKPSTTVTGATTAGAAVPPSPPVTGVTLALVSGGADVLLARNETRALAPGSYGRLETRAGAIVELTSGRYRFDSFRLLKDSRIRLDLTAGPVIVDVTGRMRLGRRTRMVVTSAVGDAEGVFFQKQGPGRVRLKKGGRYLGTFLAPDADLKLGRFATLEGALYGREANAKVGAELTQRPALAVFISLYVP